MAHKQQSVYDKENVSPIQANGDKSSTRRLLKPRPQQLSLGPQSVTMSLDSAGQEQSSSPSFFQFPPPSVMQLPRSTISSENPYHGDIKGDDVSCAVELEGYLCLKLKSGIFFDIAPNMAMRLRNTRQDCTIAMSSCSTQMALVHPRGRVLKYGPRLEIQTEDKISIKNAKIHPKGVSFTANNCALVYLLDEAGARSTSDLFHDLHASHISDTLFLESSRRGVDQEWAVMAGMQMLEQVQYWKDGDDFWKIGNIYVRQTRDGLVTVEREVEEGKILLRASPNNGKIRFYSTLVQMTASLGEESHLFLRSGDRRLHYCGQTTVFTVRYAGHSAGFDEAGMLRIF